MWSPLFHHIADFIDDPGPRSDPLVEAREIILLIGTMDAVVLLAEADEKTFRAEESLEGADDRYRAAVGCQDRLAAPFAGKRPAGKPDPRAVQYQQFRWIYILNPIWMLFYAFTQFASHGFNVAALPLWDNIYCVFQIISENEVVQWHWLHNSKRYKPPFGLSRAEYNRQMQGLLSLITARSSLPLYDLRKQSSAE